MKKYSNHSFKTTQEARKTYLEIHEAFDVIEEELCIPSHDLVGLVNGRLNSSAMARANLLIIWNEISEIHDADTVTMYYDDIREHFEDEELEALMGLDYLEIVDQDRDLVSGLEDAFANQRYIIQIDSVEKMAREMLDNDKVKMLEEIGSRNPGELQVEISRRIRKMFLSIHGII